MATDTNIDMMSRDDSFHLGMGRVSVRNINADVGEDDTDSLQGTIAGSVVKSGKIIPLKKRMSGKKINKMGQGNGGAACNSSCEQVCSIF